MWTSIPLSAGGDWLWASLPTPCLASVRSGADHRGLGTEQTYEVGLSRRETTSHQDERWMLGPSCVRWECLAGRRDGSLATTVPPVGWGWKSWGLPPWVERMLSWAWADPGENRHSGACEQGCELGMGKEQAGFG